MQFKQTLVRLLLIFCPVVATAQTTYLPQGDKANIVMDRWEIIAGKDSAFNFSKTKPFGRKQVIGAAENFVKRVGANSLSKVDAYNLRSLYLNNLEYVPQQTWHYTRVKNQFLRISILLLPICMKCM